MTAFTWKLAALLGALIALALTPAASLQPIPSQGGASSGLSWPPVTTDTRPWTRWWWMGSAVDEAGLTAELEALRAAGLGGVEITPIYGVSGTEAKFVPYLSDRWVELLEHTLREARRLDLGVDMATGTGWPFGGPWIGERDASRTLTYRTWTLEGGQRLAERVRVEQTAFVRAIGNQIYEVLEVGPGESKAQGTRQAPLTRPGAGREITMTDLEEPIEANANLQVLALEQVRYPKPLPLLVLVGYSATGEIVDLTQRVASDGRSIGWRRRGAGRSTACSSAGTASSWSAPRLVEKATSSITSHVRRSARISADSTPPSPAADSMDCARFSTTRTKWMMPMGRRMERSCCSTSSSGVAAMTCGGTCRHCSGRTPARRARGWRPTTG